MDNATVRIFAGLRLGALQLLALTTASAELRLWLMAIGSHVVIGSGRHSSHNQINDLLCRAFISYGTFANREPNGVCVCVCVYATNTGKTPDGVTQLPWR